MGKYRHIKPPPQLFLREFHEEEPGVDALGIKEYNDLIRYRWGLIDDYLNELYIGIETGLGAECCTCFRWVWTTRATTVGQTDFFPPLPDCTLENNEYQIVYREGDHMYWGDPFIVARDYEIDVATNRLRFTVGCNEGDLVSIYAMHHNDIQEAYYETCAVPAMPYAYSPPVTVDRGAGRQLVFGEHSPRFLDSGRGADEYTVSNTLNTLSLTAGLGPVGAMSAIYRLMECGVIAHGEILATIAGQTLFQPEHYDNIVKPHDIGKMMVFQRTSFLHPGLEYRTDPVANTIEINAPGLVVDQPLNIWVFR